MTPIYFSLTLSIGFWTGILVHRHYASKIIVRWQTAWDNRYEEYMRVSRELLSLRKERATAEELVKRELRKRTKKTV